MFPCPWLTLSSPPKIGELIVVVTALRCSRRNVSILSSVVLGKSSIMSGFTLICSKTHCCAVNIS
jgi:hypothetical protein